MTSLKPRRLQKTWKLFINGLEDINYSSKIYDEKFFEVIKLTEELKPRSADNSRVCTAINDLLNIHIRFIPKTATEITRYKKVLFWQRQTHHKINLKEAIVVYESFSQSVAYKFLTESKTSIELIDMLAKDVSTKEMRNIAFRDSNADLNESLATVYVKERLQSPKSLGDFFVTVGLVEDWRSEGFKSDTEHIEVYKKMRNIYEHGGGHTRYYRGDVVGLDSYSQLFVSSHSVKHVVGKCRTLGRTLRSSFDKRLRRTGQELFVQYEILRHDHSQLVTLQEMRIGYRNFRRLLGYIASKDLDKLRAYKNEELLRLMIAACKFYPDNRYDITKAMVRLVTKHVKYNKRDIKTATKLILEHYLHTLDMNKRYVHVINACAASENGYYHCLVIMELDSNFISYKKQFDEILHGSLLAHKLSKPTKAYISKLGLVLN